MAYSKGIWASSRRLLAPALLLCCGGASNALPMVSVSAATPAAHESGPSPGVYEFTRDGDLAAPLTVSFALGGSATRDLDYLIWEPTAEFAPGSARAWVAILPRNDATQEGDESAIVTLQPGAGYAIGSHSEASITIGDAYAADYPGVWDTLDVDSDSGRRMTEADFAYLDASVSDGALTVEFLFNDIGSYENFALYIDVDQNPATGDYRQGRIAGQEYRVSFDTDLVRKWYLYKLRTAPPLDTSVDEQADELMATGTVVADASSGWASFSIPVTMLRNRQRLDVFAVTCPGLNVTSPGQGDRIPDYGSFDTYARKVVVRSPGLTQRVTWPDPAGDATGGGFDITGVSWTSIADQFRLALTFSEGFDPSDNQFSVGPSGGVTIDGDRDLLTGCFGIGGPIPTFGGDNLIAYNVGSVMLPSTMFYIQTDSTRAKQYFGGDRNDATWLCYAPLKTLFISGSLSLLDAFTKTLDGGNFLSQRVSTDGRVRVNAESWNYLNVSDSAPPGGAVFDSPTGLTVPAYQWDAAKTITASDPLDFGGLNATDITLVEAQLVDGNLVVKGTLKSWMNTDIGNRMEIAIDTDMNAATGVSANNPESGGPAIGVDEVFAVHSVEMAQDASVGYFGMLTPYGGITTRHDAAIEVGVNSSFSVPGWFTATIPVRALQNPGPTMRLYVKSGDIAIAGGDTAPPQPMVIPLVQAFTLADVISALRVSGGLANTTETRLNVDGVAGVSLGDAVHISRKVAGMEPNP